MHRRPPRAHNTRRLEPAFFRVDQAGRLTAGRCTTHETRTGTAVKQPGWTLHASQQAQGCTVFPFDVQAVDVQPSQPLRQALPPQAIAPSDLLREAEAQQALAELFPHLKLSALRAIQDLFPLKAARDAVWH